MFKKKDGYKVELHTPETITLFGSTKKIEKTKNRKNVPSVDVTEVVLAQCNLVEAMPTKVFIEKVLLTFASKSWNKEI